MLTRFYPSDDGSLTLGAQRLQGLFHSLSKVLFIFRSHYLFAIGLGAIFSLRRSTPPVCTALSNCATHEISTIRPGANRHNGTIALHGVTFQSALSGCLDLVRDSCTTIPRHPVRSAADSSIGCSLFTRRYSRNHSCFLVLR